MNLYTTLVQAALTYMSKNYCLNPQFREEYEHKALSAWFFSKPLKLHPLTTAIPERLGAKRKELYIVR